MPPTTSLRHLASLFKKLAKGRVQLALACLSEAEGHFPVFLILDDTLQPKYGPHFAEYQTLFDHARKNGSNYLKGHCIVALVLSVPIQLEGELRYRSVPLGTIIRQEILFVTFVPSLEKKFISPAWWKSLEHWITKKRNF